MNDKKAIIITGTPGTGKTVLAKELSLLFKKELVSTTDFAKKHLLFEEFDEKMNSYVVDQDKLSQKLAEYVEKSEDYLFIEGHMSHFLPENYVKLCIVCVTELSELRKRLENRGYSEEKVRDNLDVEIFEICLQEALECGLKTFVVDTTGSIEASLKKAKNELKGIFE